MIYLHVPCDTSPETVKELETFIENNRVNNGNVEVVIDEDDQGLWTDCDNNHEHIDACYVLDEIANSGLI